jgi:hypothetical protein
MKLMDKMRHDGARVHPPPVGGAAATRDEPAGRLRDVDVEDAVEIARRDTPQAADPGQPAPAEPQRPASHFSTAMAQDFRARWDAAQIGFVDDPRRAVQQADALVMDVTHSLAQRIDEERRQLEAGIDETSSTEHLRLALQHYRSFFQRLLTL